MDCQKRKRVRDLDKVFGGIVLEILIDQFREHHLFENWSIETLSFGLSNVHRLTGRA